MKYPEMHHIAVKYDWETWKNIAIRAGRNDLVEQFYPGETDHTDQYEEAQRQLVETLQAECPHTESYFDSETEIETNGNGGWFTSWYEIEVCSACYKRIERTTDLTPTEQEVLF